MWATRGLSARRVGGALVRGPRAAASFSTNTTICTEAFVGFTGGPVDRPSGDADSLRSQSSPTENSPRDVHKARAMIGGSGLNGFDRAWNKPSSSGTQTMSHIHEQSSPILKRLRNARGFCADTTKAEWENLQKRGEKINPCNSPAHPAAVAGVVGVLNPTEPPKSIQQSYDAHSQCFVCGNARPPPDGVGLQSFRSVNSEEIETTPSALRSEAVVGDTYQGLPGIVSTGIMDALMICHGSWQSAIVLMDKAVTPRPPLVLTKNFSVEVRDRLPPGHAVSVITKQITVQDEKEPHSVKVVMELRASGPGDENYFVCATGEALYEKVGAVRSMW